MASAPKKTIPQVLRRNLNRTREAIVSISQPSSPHFPAPLGTPTTKVPSSVPVVHPFNIPIADAAEDVGETAGDRPQDAILPMSAQRSPSNPEPNTSDKLKKAWGVTLSGLETALRLLEKSADVLPPLKSAVGGLVACLDLAQVVGDNHKEYEKLATELTSMAIMLAPYVAKLVAEDGSGSVARIIKSIEDEVTHIHEQQDRSKIMRTVGAKQDQGDVIQRYRRVESLFRLLQNDISLRTWQDTRNLRETGLLKDMSPVDDARYNSSYSTTIKRRACTAETREKVLQDLKDWVLDPEGAKVYWMNGMAGTGKTTVSYTFCRWLEETAQLGGNYFCSRVSPSCRDANNIVPTFTYHLAQYSPAFCSQLCKVLEAKPQSSKLDVTEQLKKLLQDPLKVVKAAIPDNVVVVIDALDECDDGETSRMFLEALLQIAADLPIKFFITSRPEPVIYEKMLAPGYLHSVLHLHNVEELIVEADIKKYITEALHSMSPPPLASDIERLVRRSGKLFIYAATIVRYIQHPRGNTGARLQAVLGMASTSSKQHEELDKLYTGILSAAMDPGLEEQEVNDIWLTLRTVICAEEPMTVKTLSSLLHLTDEQVHSSLEPLQSVLHVQDGTSGLVSSFHASFPDYLFDERRSGIFLCKKAEHNEVLATHCFDLMKEQLQFNICKLESSSVFDEDVVDLLSRINNSISTALSYACRYWGEHLQQGCFTDTVYDGLVDFLTHRLLFWMEVLNLKQYQETGIVALQQAQTWLKGLDREQILDTSRQIVDAEQFLEHYADGYCADSTPHIYISALPFCSKSSSVYKNYWRHTRGLLDVRFGGKEHWRPPTHEYWKYGLWVYSVAFSPDGMRIVSGSEDKTVRVWDARTGEAVAGPFEGHTGRVGSVAFSPDNTRIVSGSGDQTIRVWDARTGEAVAGPFKGHTGRVCSVAFSPDSRHIVSGSGDQTIRVWDARTGGTVAGPFKGHAGWVTSVMFSPDGTRIASGSDDYTIRVWDARTGDTVAGPFEGHAEGVESVAFSPDGTRIVSGSGDQTIRVWDARTGSTVAGPFKGHTAWVTSVAFSPDGTRIVSGSDDHTIRVWNARTGDTVAGPFEGHAEQVESVAFSPDGTRIASSSRDQTIRVWDAYAGTAAETPTDVLGNVTDPPLHHHGPTGNSMSIGRLTHSDGWVTAPGIAFSIDREFRILLPYPGNTFVTGLCGTTSIDYRRPLCMGEAWSDCYLSN